MLTNYPPEKLKSLRIRSLLTVREVSALVGLSENSITYAENGHKRPRKSNLDKLLSLYAIRIKRLENMDEIFNSRPIQQVGMVKRNGTSRGPYKAKSTTRNAG